MIGEYAVEPASVATCDSPVKFLDGFGPGTGRLIAPLPKENRWMGTLTRALSESTPRQLKSWARLEQRLMELRLSRPTREALFSPRSRPYDGTRPWIDNAVAQHRIAPFAAIIADEPQAHFPPDDADGLQPLFQAVRGLRVPRTGSAIVDAVRPLLNLSSRVILVDPYFDPELTRFQGVVTGILACLPQAAQVEIVTSTHRPAAAWPAKITRHLEPLVPAGMEVQVSLFEEQEPGPKLHARYILTDVGGIGVETGLDVGRPGEETDLHLLSRRQYEQAWAEYANAQGFTLAARLKGAGRRRV